MRLKHVKLAGFKSFVDPTKLGFKENLTAIVGPNGCGKSNIIDAIRWVMGESGAKHLRGESMTDVIFNGSQVRKPVNRAAVELVFDNHEGKARGSAAGYQEISVRRELDRDSKSSYILNGTACRKRDITDIFLGTGISPRSYAIIEQGTISRLIESKPEELRTFIEEAAGISRYKDRRRETENRIRRTRENLDRVNDLKDELTRQVAKLERQAEAAKRYQRLKQDERRVKGEILGLTYQQQLLSLSSSAELIEQLEQQLADQQASDAALKSQLDVQQQVYQSLADRVEQAQAAFYQKGADVSQLQERIRFDTERKLTLKRDLDELLSSASAAKNQYMEDQQHLEQLVEQQAHLAPEIDIQDERLAQLAEHVQEHQEQLLTVDDQWQTLQQQLRDAQRQVDQLSQKQQFEQQTLSNLTQREAQLRQRENELKTDTLEDNSSTFDLELAQLEEQITRLNTVLDDEQQALLLRQEQLDKNRKQQNEQQSELRKAEGELASLVALQKAAREDSPTLQQWLNSQDEQLDGELIEQLEVENDWRFAVESVLGLWLKSHLVKDLSLLSDDLPKREFIALIETKETTDQMAASGASGDQKVSSELKDSLIHQVMMCPASLSWLAPIRCCEDLDTAIEQRAQLQSGQSWITPCGAWVGQDWLMQFSDKDPATGVIERAQNIRELKQRIAHLNDGVEKLQAGIDQGKQALSAINESRQGAQSELKQVERHYHETQRKLAVLRSRQEQQQRQREQLATELGELETKRAQSEDVLTAVMEELELNKEHLALQESQVGVSAQTKREYQEALSEAQLQLQTVKDQKSQLGFQTERLQLRVQSLQSAIARAEQVMAGSEDKRQELEQALSLMSDDDAQQGLLEVAIEAHEQAKDDLADARERLQARENENRELLQQTQAQMQAIDQIKQQLETVRIDQEGIKQQVNATVEKIMSLPSSLVEVQSWVDALDEQRSAEVLKTSLESLSGQIGKIGAVNLAAIEELEEQRERLNFITQQYDDLIQASEILESAIQKIDRETKQRFKQTFDFVNEGFKTLFPKVFGGGKAYLELIDQDLLSTGIAIMARPPGKQNSTIHLLSGGEKALTALALVFAIFELNPAPFCLLDEVDAPLDDVNVERYNNLVKEMSKKVQFIFITHNKITMQMANALMGVTMKEPGVSAIVSVDLEKAIDMTQAV
ncbi:MAG: chromosome segregation protein SMC [Pseudomonadota bacterium]|nr:chromosome segregation protein SMC [Pseudomonadota bacterium]